MSNDILKILLVGYSDIGGGAPLASYRLHQAFLNAGIDSKMLVIKKNTIDATVIESKTAPSEWKRNFRIKLERLPVALSMKRGFRPPFSLQWVPSVLVDEINDLNPDIVNLHWLSNAAVRLENLREIKKPVIWTLHDMYAFTGGCSYSGSCLGYEQSCGSCPILNSHRQNDLSRKVYQRKYITYSKWNFGAVSPSQWLGQAAKKSSLFSKKAIKIIPNPIDTVKFCPLDKKIAYQKLALPLEYHNAPMILFGATGGSSDPRKGFDLFVESLGLLRRKKPGFFPVVLVYGGGIDKNVLHGCPVINLGRIDDEEILIAAYSAADCFVLPSREDNLPNTMVEAMACGLPCIGFEIGGLPDLIINGQTGYLSKPYDCSELAGYLELILENRHLQHELSVNSRSQIVSKCHSSVVAGQYLDFMNETIEAGECKR